MGHRLGVWIALVVGIGFGAAGGYAASGGSRAEVTAIRRELTRQTAAIERMEARIAELARLPARATNVPGPSNGDPSAVEVAVEKALQRTGEAQAEMRRLEAEEAARPSDEELAAFVEAESLVDAALRSRTWNQAQADKLRDLGLRLNGAQSSSLTQRLASAVDAGRLHVQTDGPPF